MGFTAFERKSSAMRVLHIVGNLDINSGVMSMIMSYYRFIKTVNLQFDFLYFYSTANSYEDEIRELGGNCYKLEEPSLRFIHHFRRDIEIFFQEKKGIYEAVHYHAVCPGLFCLKAAGRSGVEKIIIHSHNTRYADYRIRAIRNAILTKATMKYGTHACACSHEAAEFLFGKEAVLNKRVTILENAIDYSKFQYSSEKRLKIRSELQMKDKLMVGHVGRLEKQKNHHFLLDIFSEIKRMRGEAVLVLIGDGELKKELESKAEELQIRESVYFLGTRKDINAMLQGMDIFLFPSLFEGLGIALIEAQVSGLPCVASNEVPESTQITPGVSYLGLKQNPCVWAERVLKAYDNHDRSNIVPENRFSIDTAVIKLEKLYKS